MKKTIEVRTNHVTQEYLCNLLSFTESEEFKELLLDQVKEMGDNYSMQYHKGAITGFMMAVFLTNKVKDGETGENCIID